MTILQSTQTATAALCCEECIQAPGCLWSIWEASGQYLGSCYLALLADNNNNNNKDANGEEHKQARDAAEDKESGVCRKQEQKGIFGYSGKNGEVRYVVSNGLCGLLVQA